MNNNPSKPKLCRAERMKKYQAEYNKRPEVVAKKKAQNKAYSLKPEVIAKRAAAAKAKRVLIKQPKILKAKLLAAIKAERIRALGIDWLIDSYLASRSQIDQLAEGRWV